MSAMEFIAKSVATGNSNATITFSNIPQTYGHLYLVGTIKNPASENSGYFLVTVNGNSTGVYNSATMINRANGTQAYGVYDSSSFFNFNGSWTGDAGNQASVEFTFLGYTNTSRYKPVIWSIDASDDSTTFGTSQRLVTNIKLSQAISTITLTPASSANYTTGTGFWLYGIKES